MSAPSLGEGIVTVGKAARLTGVSVKMICWYEAKGLLPPASRTAANYRLAVGEGARAESARLPLSLAGRGWGWFRRHRRASPGITSSPTPPRKGEGKPMKSG